MWLAYHPVHRFLSIATLVNGHTCICLSLAGYKNKPNLQLVLQSLFLLSICLGVLIQVLQIISVLLLLDFDLGCPPP